MNQIDNLTTSNLTSSNLRAVISTANSSNSTYLDATKALFREKVSFGSHTFNTEQLGQLLSYLLAQHPDISI